MAKYQFVKGTTSQTVNISVNDSSSTTGAKLTGLAFNSGSLVAYYIREGDAAATAITLATMTVGTWATGGFKEISSANMPGAYQLGIPDACLATGAKWVHIVLKGASNMVQVDLEIELTATNNQDGVRGGMTALPNAAAEAAGGLYTRGTGAGQLSQSANGELGVATLTKTLTTYTGNTVQTGDAYARLGAPAGASVSADVAAVKAVDDAIKAKTDSLTFTVANQVDSNVKSNAGTAITSAAGVQEVKVASIAANAITATSINADAITNAKIADDAIAVENIKDAAITAAKIASDAITAAKVAADVSAEIADAVWDEAIAGHVGAGSTGEALSAAGSAGDPWTTPLPGAYVAGTAGQLVGDGLAAVPPTATQNADAVLKRDWTLITGEAARSTLNALRFMRNGFTIAGTTLSVLKEDDVTTAYTRDLATDASAVPIVGVS